MWIWNYIYVCLPLIYELFPLQTGGRSSMSNERDSEFVYNFLIICRYFNLVCNKRIILKQAEHSQVVKIFTFWTDYGGKYVIFFELSMSGNLLCTIRGDNIYYSSILRPLLFFIYAYQGNYYSCGTRQLPLAEQELLFILEQPSSLWVILCDALVFCVVFIDHWFLMSLSYCIVCLS
jgi:hypothetical protein